MSEDKSKKGSLLKSASGAKQKNEPRICIICKGNIIDGVGHLRNEAAEARRDQDASSDSEKYFFVKFRLPKSKDNNNNNGPQYRVEKIRMSDRIIPSHKTTLLLASAKAGCLRVVEFLIRRGTNVDGIMSLNNDGPNAPTYREFNLSISAIKSLLEADNDYDPGISTPLMRATLEGHVAVVKYLIKEGADMSIETKEGETPLTYSSGHGHLGMVKILLASFADTEVGNPTPLMRAVREGYFEIVEQLLISGSDINKENEIGETALGVAAENGYLDIVRILIENFADVERGRPPPLVKAAKEGHYDVAKVLLLSGAEVNKQSMNGETALSIACGRGHLHMVQLLLSAKADPDPKRLQYGAMSPLMRACQNGRLSVAMYLLGVGVDVNRRTPADLRPKEKLRKEMQKHIEYKNKGSYTALLFAAERGHERLVELLLNNGADIEAKSDEANDTALLLACLNGRYNVVKVLLRRGANKEHRNASDYTPLSLAAFRGHEQVIRLLIESGAKINPFSKLGITPLMMAAMAGQTETVKLLLDYGADINAQSRHNKSTALILACSGGKYDVAKFLLQRKAYMGHRTESGMTPLMEAAGNGHLKIVKLLIDNGAEVNTAPVPTTKDTALTIAALAGRHDVVELLIKSGASINATNRKGDTPIWLACQEGHLETVKVLFNHGADLNLHDNNDVSCLVVAFRNHQYRVSRWVADNVQQFPSDSVLEKYEPEVNLETLRKNPNILSCYRDCVEYIKTKRNIQAAEANKNATMLLEELEMERKQEESRRLAAQRRREKKKRKKLEKKLQLGLVDGSSAAAHQKEQEEEEEGKDQASAWHTHSNSKKRRSQNRANANQAQGTISYERVFPGTAVYFTIGNQAGKQKKKCPTKKFEESRGAEDKTWGKALTHPSHSRNSVTRGHSSSLLAVEASNFGAYGETQDEATDSPNALLASLSLLANQLDDEKPEEVGFTRKERQNDWKEVKSKRPSVNSQKNIMVPPNAISRVIGRGGSNINLIREATGARIEVEQQGKQPTQTPPAERLIQMRGSIEATSKAHRLIKIMIQEPDKNLKELIEEENAASGESTSFPCKPGPLFAGQETTIDPSTGLRQPKKMNSGNVGCKARLANAQQPNDLSLVYSGLKDLMKGCSSTQRRKSVIESGSSSSSLTKVKTRSQMCQTSGLDSTSSSNSSTPSLEKGSPNILDPELILPLQSSAQQIIPCPTSEPTEIREQDNNIVIEDFNVAKETAKTEEQDNIGIINSHEDRFPQGFGHSNFVSTSSSSLDPSYLAAAQTCINDMNPQRAPLAGPVHEIGSAMTCLSLSPQNLTTSTSSGFITNCSEARGARQNSLHARSKADVTHESYAYCVSKFPSQVGFGATGADLGQKRNSFETASHPSATYNPNIMHERDQGPVKPTPVNISMLTSIEPIDLIVKPIPHHQPYRQLPLPSPSISSGTIQRHNKMSGLERLKEVPRSNHLDVETGITTTWPSTFSEVASGNCVPSQQKQHEAYRQRAVEERQRQWALGQNRPNQEIVLPSTQRISKRVPTPHLPVFRSPSDTSGTDPTNQSHLRFINYGPNWEGYQQHAAQGSSGRHPIGRETRGQNLVKTVSTYGQHVRVSSERHSINSPDTTTWRTSSRNAHSVGRSHLMKPFRAGDKGLPVPIGYERAQVLKKLQDRCALLDVAGGVDAPSNSWVTDFPNTTVTLFDCIDAQALPQPIPISEQVASRASLPQDAANQLQLRALQTNPGRTGSSLSLLERRVLANMNSRERTNVGGQRPGTSTGDEVSFPYHPQNQNLLFKR